MKGKTIVAIVQPITDLVYVLLMPIIGIFKPILLMIRKMKGKTLEGTNIIYVKDMEDEDEDE